MNKAVKNIKSILILFIMITVIMLSFFFFHAKGNIEELPSFFRYKPLTVLSNSMKPTFAAGDIILIHVGQEPQMNDVITYKHPDGYLVTHRVFKKVKEEGKTFYHTKGDNNNVADDLLIPRTAIVGVEQIVIPYAGYVANFVSRPIGFFIFIVLPLFILVIYELFKWLGFIDPKEEQSQKTDQI